MAADSSDNAVRLDPVLVEALKDLRSFTYRRRRLQSTAPVLSGLPGPPPGVLDVVKALAHLRIEDRERSLDDPGARSGAIHLFKHLKHHGYTWNQADIHAWALTHGFTAEDARRVSEYAEGVQAGTRYHTAPDPFGKRAIVYWQEDAQRQQ
jgi:hypothetical protein